MRVFGRLLGWGALAALAAMAGPAFAQTAAEHAATATTAAHAATALPFDPDQATREWLNTMDPAARARSDSYFEGGYWIQFVGPIIGFVIAFLVLQLGWAKGVRTWLEKTVKVYFLVVIGFFLFYSLIGLVTLPWDYWVGFVREHDYGLSRQTLAQWSTEAAQGFGINLAVGSIGIAILYFVIWLAKKNWWVWGTVVAIALLAVSSMLAPVYIAPIFNHYTPMAESPLRTSVLQTAQANGVPADNVYVFDVSRQSNRVTANVSGFAGTTRISMADNLINRESPGGVRAVLGHEIGHYVLNHTVSLMVMFTLLIVIVFALANWLFNRLSAGERWGIRNVWDPAGMPLLFSIIGFMFLIATPIQNNIVRFHEHQADMFGLNAAREPDGFAESALLLSEYRKMEPSAFEEWFFYDHPSGYDRIHMAMVWKAHHMALGDIPMGPGGPPPGWHPDFVVMQHGANAAPSPAAQSSTVASHAAP
ncbi:MAG: M48 family metallopeptidase [Vitreimonas sp.]